jgi:predicted component of type VI protein secretion system
MSYMMQVNNSQPGRYNTNVNMTNARNNTYVNMTKDIVPAAAAEAPAPAPANNNLNSKSHEELVEYYKTLGGDEPDLEGMDDDAIREQITELLKIVQGGGRRRRTHRHSRASRKTRRRSRASKKSRRRSSRK